MQQGRITTDEDVNALRRIRGEDRRRARAEIIGPAGSPDNGFRITDPRETAGGQVEFDIAQGAFYLGGLRLEMTEPQTFRTQTDRLQMPSTAHDAPATERYDMVLLEAYEQPVSAVEDSELYEVALGGPDTSARMRLMQRVLLAEDVQAQSCEQAWQKLVDGAKAKWGVLNKDNEVVPSITLTVGYVADGDPESLCTPQTAGGYLGAENQAIRVQLVDPDHLTWGFDNASPLYRVRADDPKTLTMLTEPRDQAHWPLANQVVEILPWAAVLPNNEKLAEIRGHLSLVETSYTPDTGTLTLTDAVPAAGFDNWAQRSDAGELDDTGRYYFMRVWDRGPDRSSDPAIPFTPGTPVTLGHTGLQVTINGPHRRPGDHWIIAARPETPNHVVPWELETGRPPHGVRRFYAPLALIHWVVQNGVLSADVHDCRRRFRPLTQQETCCTLIVGNGVTSHGHYDSIEEAVQRLPPWGGTICLLPGLHRASVTIENRYNVTIRGCDRNTFVLPRVNHLHQPVFTVKDAHAIVLEHMGIATLEDTAVALAGSEMGKLDDVEVSHCRMFAFKHAVHVTNGTNVRIEDNIIRMLDKDGGDVAIYLLAEDALIARNDIEVVPAGVVPPTEPTDDDQDKPPDPSDPCAEPEILYANWVYFMLYLVYVWTTSFVLFLLSNPYKALGGIQIGSGSERVRVRDNQITGGAGNGITLGSDLDPADLPIGDDVDDRIHTVVAYHGVVVGDVTLGNAPIAGLTLAFHREGFPPITPEVTDAEGRFLAKAGDGEYRVHLSDPAYAIDRVDKVESDRYGLFNHIRLVEAQGQVDLGDVLAFIYEVTIEDNEIANMGLSGIGIPQVELEELAGLPGLRQIALKQPQVVLLLMLAVYFGILSGFVVDLTIQRNHIRNCLQNLFDPRVKGRALGRGVGGISLGLCERLLIHRNRIEDNGINGFNPVCGIFCLFAEQVAITENELIGNGPPLQAAANVQAGMWGGIVVALATSLSLTDYALRLAEAGSLGGMQGEQAARIHDNVIRQPIGRALTLGAFGPVSVLSNRLNSDVAGPALLDRLVGGVLIANLGGIQNLIAARMGMQQAAFQQTHVVNEAAATPGDTETYDARAYYARARLVERRTVSPGLVGLVQIHPRFPGGNTLFNDNQVRLGPAHVGVIGQLILTADDLGFDGNQSAMLAAASGIRERAQINTLLLGMTLRATGNRFQEIIQAVQAQQTLSLLTLSLLMNNTTCNQGNHCIIALCLLASMLSDPTLKVSVGNQSVFPRIPQCSEYEAAASSDPRALLPVLVALLRSAS
jgi:hypothetical protein